MYADKNNDDPTVQRVDNELGIWQTLSHKYIVPLLGICKLEKTGGKLSSFVSPWFAYGSLTRFVKQCDLSLLRKLGTVCFFRLTLLQSLRT